jgi:septum formation protein
MPHLTQQLVLGSSSIYRRELLQRLQIPFEICSPDIDETPLPGEVPGETALRLAEKKARVGALIYPDGLIIGADQVAVLESTPLGKPLTHENAVSQLRLLSGREVIFYTALSLFNSRTNSIQTRLTLSHVKFRELNDQKIENYLVKEQPYNCAGSAKSEGLGIALIERIVGDDPNGLIGLPLIALVEMLSHEGIEVI